MIHLWTAIPALNLLSGQEADPERLHPGGGPRARWVDGMGLTTHGYGVAPIASRTAWAIVVAESRLSTAGSRLVRTMTEAPVS